MWSIPELSSSLDNIFLISLFKTNDKKCHENIIIFKNLISEFIYLETLDIFITVNDQVHQIFLLGLTLNDNSGLDSLLGFTESFVSNYPRRLCKTNKNKFHVQVDKNLRNLTNYSDNLIKNNVSLQRIKDQCVWNEIRYFYVI